MTNKETIKFIAYTIIGATLLWVAVFVIALIN